MPEKKAGHNLINKIPYLRVLTPPQRDSLLEGALLRHFTAHEIIFLEGDSAAGLWIIETGQVKIAKLNPNGDEYILHLLGVGESFNDIAALENGLNPANASALTESSCWLIPTGAIQEILETSPQAAKAAIQMLTARVRGLVQQLENLALYSVTARLARFLLQQAETANPEGGGVTRVAIAAHLATTPESISRALRGLEEAGAIRFNRHQIEIVELQTLRVLAQLDPS